MNPTASQQPYTIPQAGLPVQAPVLQAVQMPLTNKMEKYKTTIANFGIAEIVLGGIIFVLDIVTLCIAYDIGQGIWCGSFLIASGIVAVVTRSQPSYSMVQANIALSILAAISMTVLVILSSLYAASYYWYWYTAAIGLQSTIAVLAFVGLVTAIVHSAYSCAGANNTNSQNQVVYPVQMSNGQVIVGPNQMNQPGVYPVYQYANPAMVVPTAQNQQPVSSNQTAPMPALIAQAGPAVFAPVQGPQDAQSPPYSYSPIK